MNWLDEAKIDITTGINLPKPPVYVLIRRTTADRMIAIVEGAHKHMDDVSYPYCPVCVGHSEQVGPEVEPGCYDTAWAHYDTCPYSDEY